MGTGTMRSKAAAAAPRGARVIANDIRYDAMGIGVGPVERGGNGRKGKGKGGRSRFWHPYRCFDGCVRACIHAWMAWGGNYTCCIA